MSLRFQHSLKGIAIGFALQLVQPCFSACFQPNGLDRNTVVGVADGYYYAPCNHSAAVSMCCAIGPGRAGDPDLCLPNGLCYNTVGGLYWRESCTDPTWQNQACIKLFVTGPDAGNDVAVTSCSDGSWCEGGDAVACCNAGQGYFIVDGEETTQRPSSSGTSSAMSATANTPSSPSSSSTTTTTTSPPPSSSSSGSSGGLSPGAVSGISIGGIIIAGLGVGIAWRQLRVMHKARRPEGESHYALGGYHA